MTHHPEQPWQPSNPPPPRPPKQGWFSSHKIMTILIGSVLLVGLCCGGASLAFVGDGGSSAGTSSTTEDVASKTTSAAEETTTEDEPAEETTTEDEPAEEPTTEDEPTESLSVEQENAIRSAESYLDFMAFSKQGLIEQLSSEAGDGYPEDVARFAVEHIEDDVDWNEQAVKSAESYLELMPFSRAELIDQLSSDAGDGFTREQAEYAADEVGL